MTTPEPGRGTAEADNHDQKKGRLKAVLLPLAMRHGLGRRALGIQVVFRSTGGGLIVGGLSYAALFALIPTLVLVVAGVFLLVDDPQVRQDAVDLLGEAFPAFAGITDAAVQGANRLASVGGIIAIFGFLWGASGLYLNLTRAMERFFPGERVSGALARIMGVLLVVGIIVGVLAAVFVAGVVTVVAQALRLDAQWLLAAASAVATLVIAAALVYGIYRTIPANPPSARSARLPAVLVGSAIALMTLLYSVISPWLVSGYQAFGVMASVFVALVWLRVFFLAMVYGAAMARYRDFVTAGSVLGEAEPDLFATRHVMAQELERATRELESAHEIERRRQASGDVEKAQSSEDAPSGD